MRTLFVFLGLVLSHFEASASRNDRGIRVSDPCMSYCIAVRPACGLQGSFCNRSDNSCKNLWVSPLLTIEYANAALESNMEGFERASCDLVSDLMVYVSLLSDLPTDLVALDQGSQFESEGPNSPSKRYAKSVWDLFERLRQSYGQIVSEDQLVQGLDQVLVAVRSFGNNQRPPTIVVNPHWPQLAKQPNIEQINSSAVADFPLDIEDDSDRSSRSSLSVPYASILPEKLTGPSIDILEEYKDYLEKVYASMIMDDDSDNDDVSDLFGESPSSPRIIGDLSHSGSSSLSGELLLRQLPGVRGIYTSRSGRSLSYLNSIIQLLVHCRKFMILVVNEFDVIQSDQLDSVGEEFIKIAKLLWIDSEDSEKIERLNRGSHLIKNGFVQTKNFQQLLFEKSGQKLFSKNNLNDPQKALAFLMESLDSIFLSNRDNCPDDYSLDIPPLEGINVRAGSGSSVSASSYSGCFETAQIDSLECGGCGVITSIDSVQKSLTLVLPGGDRGQFYLYDLFRYTFGTTDVYPRRVCSSCETTKSLPETRKFAKRFTRLSLEKLPEVLILHIDRMIAEDGIDVTPVTVPFEFNLLEWLTSVESGSGEEKSRRSPNQRLRIPQLASAKYRLTALVIICFADNETRYVTMFRDELVNGDKNNNWRVIDGEAVTGSWSLGSSNLTLKDGAIPYILAYEKF